MLKLFVLIGLLITTACHNTAPIIPVDPITPPVPVNPDAPSHATGYIHRPGVPMVESKEYGLAPSELEVPKSFSWVTAGFATPIRDQGNCGSCYCHGGIQPLDGAVKIYDGKDMILSEQQCTAYSGFYKCNGGYFPGKVLEAGLVLDKDCPYHADGAGCPGGKPTTYAAKATKAINLGDGRNAPTVLQLKQAIMQFGVISCVVAATSKWNNYKSGDLTGQSSNINHLIAITGYTADGKWEMKNSWGTKWGKAGYATVPFGNFSICQEASYISYSANAAYKMIH